MNFIKISDLIYILKYFDKDKSIENKELFFQLHNEKIITITDWRKTVDLGLELNILKEKNTIIEITSKGRIVYSMSKDNSELSDEQKLFIFKNCILGNSVFKYLNNFLKLFNRNKENILELYKHNKDYEKLITKHRYILSQLDILIDKPNKRIINEKCTESILNQKLFGNSTLSQSQLDRINEEKKEIGDKGEKLTLEYEKEQFKKMKWGYQEKEVRIIGKENVKAGYDVESFLTKDSKLDDDQRGDKHIEVKSRKYDERSFFISSNELRIGKILSERENHEYLLYFWNNLGKKKKPKRPTMIIPFKKLNISPCDNCTNYFVNLD